MINGLSHLAFNCKDLAASLAFYRDILGLSVKFKITYREMAEHAIKNYEKEGKPVPAYMDALCGFGDRLWCVYLQCSERNFIELFDTVGAVNERIPSNRDLNYSHFSVEVDHLESFKAELTRKGAESCIDTDISKGVDGSIQMWLHDPDGNKIEVMEYTPDSMQLQER